MVAHVPRVGSASLFEILQFVKSVDVAVGMFNPPLVVENAYQVFPTWIRDGSGKFKVITGPLESDLLELGYCSDKMNREKKHGTI